MMNSYKQNTPAAQFVIAITGQVDNKYLDMAIDLPLLLQAYANGVFPMADARDDIDTFWVEPKVRAILPLDGLKISHSLAKTIRQDKFKVTSDTVFADVIDLCAAAADDRPDTWINDDIEAAFLELHARGMAHSVEVWELSGGKDRLVGGLYGLALGRVFCGESMFFRASNASKVALVWLVARLRLGGFTLLDCQFMTDHLASLGAIEISQSEYLTLLRTALDNDANQAVGDGLGAGLAATGAGGFAGAPGFAGDWGSLDGFLSSPSSFSSVSPAAGLGSSSPGKLILHSLTQTS
jgi:leucyl/phenylalanyl-tRNA---protein transferase